jgi:RHS repeat-associated protein
MNPTSSFSESYDDNGNALYSTSGATLTYYPDNRLKTVTAGTTETNSYDGEGRLTFRTGSQWAYDGDFPTYERSSATNSAQIERLPLADGELQILYSPSSAPMYAHSLSDPLGNAAVVTDNVGTVTEEDDADLYGTNPKSGTSSKGNPANDRSCLSGWGYRYRPSAGVYQVGARVYDPVMGRFLQQDPISFGEGDYTYAGNDPVNAIDPSGLAVDVKVAGSGHYQATANPFTVLRSIFNILHLPHHLRPDQLLSTNNVPAHRAGPARQGLTHIGDQFKKHGSRGTNPNFPSKGTNVQYNEWGKNALWNIVSDPSAIWKFETIGSDNVVSVWSNVYGIGVRFYQGTGVLRGVLDGAP